MYWISRMCLFFLILLTFISCNLFSLVINLSIPPSISAYGLLLACAVAAIAGYGISFNYGGSDFPLNVILFTSILCFPHGMIHFSEFESLMSFFSQYSLLKWFVKFDIVSQLLFQLYFPLFYVDAHTLHHFLIIHSYHFSYRPLYPAPSYQYRPLSTTSPLRHTLSSPPPLHTLTHSPPHTHTPSHTHTHINSGIWPKVEGCFSFTAETAVSVSDGGPVCPLVNQMAYFNQVQASNIQESGGCCVGHANVIRVGVVWGMIMWFEWVLCEVE